MSFATLMVHADVATAGVAKHGIADHLIDLARVEGADLIVTGAYGHSRLGEWIFGGVTQELLASSPVCCLLSNSDWVLTCDILVNEMAQLPSRQRMPDISN